MKQTGAARHLYLYMLVAVGAAIGGVLRFAVSDLWLGAAELPWGTLLVNVAGSLLIGFYASLPMDRFWTTNGPHLFVTAGFCGGFTTFSIFSLEMVEMMNDGRTLLAAVWMLLSLLIWLGGAALGHLMGRQLSS